ncbi:bactofilin family protein [Citrobacter koseri]|uniref:polymer-forming cytoskeletal protein n=1 Tax=Citrobacter koseri TaxID=545 RepID=UPI000E02AE67|nr:polymer-forming cytoskeletal protein [Citrobacter koseri]STB73286.1 Uncharacterised protein [Citrobacter koseri]STT23466.1 Uncharacterised protein [Citrobacter koseri]
MSPERARRQAAGRIWLWGVWLSWALLLVLWLCTGDNLTLRHPRVAAGALVLWCAGFGALVIYILTRRGRNNMQLLKKKKPDAAPETHREGSITPVVRKDVFIARGSRLSGLIEAESNIVTEGCIEGDVTSTHQVRWTAAGR